MYLPVIWTIFYISTNSSIWILQFYIGFVYPSGKPRNAPWAKRNPAHGDLLRCRGFAVADYSFTLGRLGSGASSIFTQLRYKLATFAPARRSKGVYPASSKRCGFKREYFQWQFNARNYASFKGVSAADQHYLRSCIVDRICQRSQNHRRSDHQRMWKCTVSNRRKWRWLKKSSENHTRGNTFS